MPAISVFRIIANAPPRGSQRHGTYYLYSNWDFNALGTIFEQETGRNIYDAFDSGIATLIGMQDWKRDIQEKSGDSTRSRHRAYHIVIISFKKFRYRVDRSIQLLPSFEMLTWQPRG